MSWRLGLSILLPLAGCHMLLGFDEESSDTTGAPGGTAGEAPTVGGMGGAPGTGGAGAAPIGGHGGTGGATSSDGGGPTGGGSPGGGGAGGGSGCVSPTEADFASAPAAPTVDDDFSDPASSLTTWGAMFFATNEAGYTGSTPCTAELCNGTLRLTPGPPGTSEGYFWHSSFGNTQDQSGPLVYQAVVGDFAFEARVEIVPNGDPTDLYSGAAIVARNPNAFNHYVQYGLGKRNSDTIVTLGRLRHPSGSVGSGQTVDVGTANPTTATGGRLLLCRIGDSFSFHRRLDGEPVGTTDSKTTLALGFDAVPELQVGLSVHWFHGFNASYDGVFDDVQIHPSPSSHDDCRALLDP